MSNNDVDLCVNIKNQPPKVAALFQSMEFQVFYTREFFSSELDVNEAYVKSICYQFCITVNIDCMTAIVSIFFMKRKTVYEDSKTQQIESTHIAKAFDMQANTHMAANGKDKHKQTNKVSFIASHTDKTMRRR